MIKIDLHTHSVESPDGGLNEKEYFDAFKYSELDLVAITDHNSLDFAKYLQKHQVIGSSIIIGAEITTTDGDIIGLYLKNLPPTGLNAAEAAKHIRNQGGLVLIPHPEDGGRSSLNLVTIKKMKTLIDGIESHNGRRIGGKQKLEVVRSWAAHQSIPLIACSDAHSYSGIGRTYTRIPELPANAADLKRLLNQTIRLEAKRPPLSAYLAPKANRLLKSINIRRDSSS